MGRARPEARKWLAGVLLVSTWVAGGPAMAEGRPEALVSQARAAFERRATKGSALRAVELYGSAIAAGGGYAAHWEGARAAFHYGYFVIPEGARRQRLKMLKQGAEWAKGATRARPRGAEGHFYRASLLGGWGEVRGLAGGMVVAGEIRRSAEKALALDRGVECAGPLRLMGRYYFMLPRAFGGNTKRSLGLLEEALRRCPSHPQVHVYLAETLHALGRSDQARARAQWVLDHPGPGLEYRLFRANAQALLDRM